MTIPETETSRIPFDLDDETAEELNALCKMMNLSPGEALSTALKFFCQGCKDTLKNFARGVRTPIAEAAK